MKKFLSTLSLVVFFSLFLGAGARAATITVTEKTDSFDGSVCSLRNAIQSMNNDADFGGCTHTGLDYGNDDTILLETGDYVLSLSGQDDNNNAGDLDICLSKKDLLIQGQGSELTNITANFVAEKDRIVEIWDCAGGVTFQDLAISNGGDPNSPTIDGAGIHNINFVLLRNAAVRDNFGDQGGGIRNESAAVIEIFQSQITGNHAFQGAGIFTDGALFMDESTVDNNEAFNGGGILSHALEMAISNSTISNNRAIAQVGTLGSPSPAVAITSGGGLSVDVCNATVLINTTISSNRTDGLGGGIIGIQGACFAGGPPTVRGAFLFNSTVASNQAGDEGGGIYSLSNITSTVDTAGFPGFFPQVNLQSSILADNDAPTGPDCFNFISSFGFNLVESLSDCTLFDTRVDPNVTGQDPQLGPLQDNGGPTKTQGLAETSPAIDAGNDGQEGCDAPDLQKIFDSGDFTTAPLTRDQRNFLRPVAVRDPNNALCDIGAFEFQVFDFTVTKDDGLDGTVIDVGTDFEYTITVTNDGPGDASNVTLNDPLPSGMEFVAVTSSQGTCAAIGQVVGCNLGDLALGETATITIAVTAVEPGEFTNIATVTVDSDVEQQITKTAQVTTTVGGQLVFGSGIHCELQRGAAQGSPRLALALGAMVLIIFAGYGVLRRRTQN